MLNHHFKANGNIRFLNLVNIGILVISQHEASFLAMKFDVCRLSRSREHLCLLFITFNTFSTLLSNKLLSRTVLIAISIRSWQSTKVKSCGQYQHWDKGSYFYKGWFIIDKLFHMKNHVILRDKFWFCLFKESGDFKVGFDWKCVRMQLY